MGALSEKNKTSIKNSRKILEKLKISVERAADRDLFHIDVYRIADRAGITRQKMLGAFIQGVHEGLFTMEWIYHCPNCGGVSRETLSIHAATQAGPCSMCKIDFENVLDETVQVFFSVHPEKRKLDESLADTYHRVIENAVQTDHLFKWHGDTVIRGADVIHNPAYRELMGDDILLPDQSLEIKQAAILFTDIKESTRMYTILGDARAFQLVREHFNILFTVIEEYDGVAVKTIGDAVMGVFNSRVSALGCSLEAQKRLAEFYSGRPDNERIEVKIGIHSGTTIVVTLNKRLDYFGTTVNTAARIQGISRPNEVVVSETVFDSPAVNGILSQYNASVNKTEETFKGISGTVPVYHLSVQK